MAKRNWDKIRTQKNEDNARFRDVYEDQQLDRGHIEKKETMFGRSILAAVAALFSMGVIWYIIASIEMFGVGYSINGKWIEALYEKPYQKSNYQYITLRVEREKTDEEGNIVIDEEGNPVMNVQFDRYLYRKDTGEVFNIDYKKMPGYHDFSKDPVYDEEGNLISGEEPTEENSEENSEETEAEFVPFVYYKLNCDLDNLDGVDSYLGYIAREANDKKRYGYVFRENAISAYLTYDEEMGNSDDVQLDMTKIRDEEYLKQFGLALEPNKFNGYRLNLKGQPEQTNGKERFIDLRPTPLKMLFAFLVGGIVFGLLYFVMQKNLKAQNIMSDTSDINQYHNDQHIALPEEVQTLYDIFPDVGAHSNVMVSSMISHQMITNKGLKKVELAKRAKEDIKDEDGDIIMFKGDILRNEDGDPITETVPIIDNEFSEALWDSSKTPKDKYARKYYDTTRIPYNPGNANLDKLKDYNTVAELINKDWTFPVYEPQRPGGVYIVDTAPVNTMVLAITRAGKGQTIIEPTIDMWTRENRPNNMVINDPKGELLVKNYVRGTVRGFTIVQFNLINPMKTDIYNPLALAAEAARDGNSTKCAMYVENIAEVFFPLDGGEDPLWPNAANNAFKRAAYGLIDYYLEEEKEMRRIAAVKNVDKKVLEQKIDEMWGRVTLYNCYQMFTQMSSRKQQDPIHVTADKIESAEKEGHPFSDDDVERMSDEALEMNPIWEGNKEADLLTLYFSATDKLPKNSMRTLVSNANSALKAMGGAEKMMASVYGIAITAMSFFTDPTISTLTSGTISQNVDLAGLSFPRRFGVRFHMDYLKDQHLVGMQCIWESFSDPEFKNNLGKDFFHEDTVSREGWARYFFKGCYKDETAYVRLKIKDVQSEMIVKTFYFKFTKDYQTSYDGKKYMKDPVLDTKIVKNGFLTELVKVKKKDNTIVFKEKSSTFEKDTITNIIDVAQEISEITDKDEKARVRAEKLKRESVKTNIFINLSAKYQEKCKMVFLVTPPHLMKYAKLILILIKQLVDLNFDQSYMTKANQKPLYKTRYMLDELGNLQSEGHGISGFETMLSIGLGQEQQFTLILQTLQQLKDVYGDSVDKIVQGNTSNIVFLKSTDDSMIETLSKMSGVRHKTYTDSKVITKDIAAVTSFAKNEDKVSYTMSTKEEPVISYNDMASIPPCNSIVFRAGDSPIWNRNETALPMSWRLFKNTIINPGKEYTLQTIPSLSTAKDFDVKQNQPDFSKMFDKRLRQAAKAEKAMQYYKDVYNYTDDQVQKLDVDVYSDEIMEMISTMMHPDLNLSKREEEVDTKAVLAQTEVESTIITETAQKNDDVQAAMANDRRIAAAKEAEKKIYANKTVSKRDLYTPQFGVNHSLDDVFSMLYNRLRNHFAKDSQYFRIDANNNLVSADGSKTYIIMANNAAMANQMNKAAKDPKSRVMAEGDVDGDAVVNNIVTDDFYKFLASFDEDWPFIRGEFSRQVAALQNLNN